MKFLVTSDLHLTVKPEDEYRWEFLEWLVEYLDCQGDIDYLFILGDLTEAKDKHSAILVNRLVDWLMRVAHSTRVVIIMGNHDYLDPDQPFFRFLDMLTDVHFIQKRCSISLYDTNFLFIPHRHNSLGRIDAREFDYVFLHQLFGGARVNGVVLPGEDLSVVGSSDRPTIFISGHVHEPQTVGSVNYVGSPYPTRFGEDHTPQVMVVDSSSSKFHCVSPPHLKKLVLKVKHPEDLLDRINVSGLCEGDHVRVLYQLNRSDLDSWETYRRETVKLCKDNSLVLFGIELESQDRVRLALAGMPDSVSAAKHTPDDLFQKFCDEKRRVISPRTRAIGKDLLIV